MDIHEQILKLQERINKLEENQDTEELKMYISILSSLNSYMKKIETEIKDIKATIQSEITDF